MTGYNIAFLIKVLEFACCAGRLDIGTEIVNTVATHPNVNFSVDVTLISRLYTRKSDVPPDIRAWAGKKQTHDYALNYVKENIYPRISEMLIYDACMEILKMMISDNIPEIHLEKMQNWYQEGKYLDFFTFAILYALCRPNALTSKKIQADDFPLLEEANGCCPLCGKNLITKKRNSADYVKHYKIVSIFPKDISNNLLTAFSGIKQEPPDKDSDENKIALCPDHANSYESKPTVEEYKKLIECKQRIEKRLSDEMLIQDSKIEDDIVDVIKAISGIKERTKLQRYSEVLTIDEKIENQNFLLRAEVKEDVVRFYPFVEKQFSVRDGIGETTFNMIRNDVNTCYEKLNKNMTDQQEIREYLVKWFINKNGLSLHHRIAARILVSFFIQNCAIFNPTENGVSQEVDNS